MPIKINGATSGSTTITSPATGGDETVELVTALAAKAATSEIKVVQIVTASHATAVTNNTTTYADTGLTATITPTTASNAVLVLVQQNGCIKFAGNVGSNIDLRLMRGATEIAKQFGGYTGTSVDLNFGTMGFAILDAPATTSATTYKTQFRNGANAAGVTVQDASSQSGIVLMEVVV